MLSKDLQDYYEAIFSTFSSKGWEYFLEDAKKLLTQYQDIRNSNSNEEFMFNRGRVDVLLWIINFKELAKQSYDTLEAESE